MIGSFGLPEILGIGVVVIILFGAKRIPEVFRGLGQGVHEFKKGLRGDAAQPLGKTAQPLGKTAQPLGKTAQPPGDGGAAERPKGAVGKAERKTA